MITVIIPALNEAKTISKVIATAWKHNGVTEVIVVDDKSMDNTIAEAKKANAKVVTSTRLGKGASMREGLQVARNDIVVFLDADIPDFPQDVIERLTWPILNDEADFVKSYFERQAGRVTELVARPLLSIFFPEINHFSQPLSGMIAGKKCLLMKVEFENDYGVDIGILIDIFYVGARMKQVSLGRITNDMQPLTDLSKMSREVSKAIFKRANVGPYKNLETLENINVIREQMEYALKDAVKELKKMIVFDMDNTLLKGSFIHTAAKHLGFEKELLSIIVQNNNDFIRTKRIAQLLKGCSFAALIEVAESIPVVEYAMEVISEYKQRGYVCGIISDSYDCITNHLRIKLDMDFSLANELEFSKSIATGEVKIPSYYLKEKNGFCEHDYCKSNVLLHISRNYGIDLKNTIAVGDAETDICMINMAGIGVSFNAKNKLVEQVADVVLSKDSFKAIADIAS